MAKEETSSIFTKCPFYRSDTAVIIYCWCSTYRYVCVTRFVLGMQRQVLPADFALAPCQPLHSQQIQQQVTMLFLLLSSKGCGSNSGGGGK